MDILCLDFDEVIIRTEPIIANEMGKVIPQTSVDYQKFMHESYQRCIITHDEYNKYLNEYRDYRNQFLEETSKEYIGLVNYKNIYAPDNFFPHAMENVRELCDVNQYGSVYITTHYNVERERKCKEELIHDCFPKAKYIPIKFFLQKYEPGLSRTRTSKATYIQRMLKIDSMNNVILIDDSFTNIDELNNMQGIGIQYLDQSNLGNIKANDELLTSLDPIEVDNKVKTKKLTLYR